MAAWLVTATILVVLSSSWGSLLEDQDGPRTLPPEEERKANCPSPDQLGHNCTCWATTFGGLYIECTSLQSKTQLKAAFSELSDKPLFGLGLFNSSLTHLPDGVLTGGLQALYLRNNSLAALRGPAPSAPFLQVATTLVHVDILGEKGTWAWKWKDLAPLTRIKTLSLRDSDVRSLDRGISLGLRPVRFLSFVNCKITKLTDDVFSELHRLRVLDLSDNQIHRLSKSMFPQRAPNLVTINLRHNRLKTVDKSTFRGLSNLQVVDLGYNLITTIGHDNYRPLFLGVKQHVYLAGNPLLCDCHLSWLTRSVKDEDIRVSRAASSATCRRPAELEDRTVNELREHELLPCLKPK